jgi:hypothetical protein
MHVGILYIVYRELTACSLISFSYSGYYLLPQFCMKSQCFVSWFYFSLQAERVDGDLI